MNEAQNNNNNTMSERQSTTCQLFANCSAVLSFLVRWRRRSSFVVVEVNRVVSSSRRLVRDAVNAAEQQTNTQVRCRYVYSTVWQLLGRAVVVEILLQ